MNDHIQKTFIHQVKADLRMELDNATKVTDPLKVIADSSQQKLMHAPSPILQSAMVVCKSVEELVDVLTELDGYRETFFSLICIVLQEFQRSIQESLQNLIHAEDDSVEIISSTLIGPDQFLLNISPGYISLNMILNDSYDIDLTKRDKRFETNDSV